MDRKLDAWVAKNLFNAFSASEDCSHVLQSPSADWKKTPDYTSNMNEAIKVLKLLEGCCLFYAKVDGADVWYVDFIYKLDQVPRNSAVEPTLAICKAAYFFRTGICWKEEECPENE